MDRIKDDLGRSAWGSVRISVHERVNNSVFESVGLFVLIPVSESIRKPVGESVWGSAKTSLRSTIREKIHGID